MYRSVASNFYHNVVAAYDEYAANRDSPHSGRDKHLRTAIAAATALYHFREHLPGELKGKIGAIEATPEYALVHGVTNAAKHGVVTKRQALVARASDVREVTVLILYSDDDGEYSHAQTMVQVKCTDGETRQLDPAIPRLLNRWGNFLRDLDVCDFVARPEFEVPGHRYLSRQEATTSHGLEVLRGLDFEQTIQPSYFDVDLGRAVPLDLTGAQMSLRIYKPPRQVLDVIMSHPDREDVTVSIPFSEEENAAFHRLPDEAARVAFKENFVKAHGPDIEQMFLQKLAEQRSDGG